MLAGGFFPVMWRSIERADCMSLRLVANAMTGSKYDTHVSAQIEFICRFVAERFSDPKL